MMRKMCLSSLPFLLLLGVNTAVGTDAAIVASLDDGSKVNNVASPTDTDRNNRKLRWGRNKEAEQNKDETLSAELEELQENQKEVEQKDEILLAELEELKEDLKLLKKEDYDILLDVEDKQGEDEEEGESIELNPGEMDVEELEEFYANVGYQYETEEDLKNVVFDADVDGEDNEDEFNEFGVRRSASCNKNKKVTLYKFCINGNGDAGANGEHQLRLDNDPLWSGYRNLREGQCHRINGGSRIVQAWKSLSGTEEHDGSSENDSHFATMPPSQWYSPSCGTYEIILSKNFKEERKISQCLDVSLSGTYKDVITGEISSSNCANWTQPDESFIWFLKIEPEVENLNWKYFVGQRHYHFHMELERHRTNNGNPVNFERRKNVRAQKWALDSWGRIRSLVDASMCIEAGKARTKYSKVFIQKCHSGLWQQWFVSDGKFKNKYNGLYLGITYCGKYIRDYRYRRLVLRGDETIDGYCNKAQKWFLSYNFVN